MTPALVIIDVQNEYFAPEGLWALPDAEAALAHIQELLAAARDARLPVFHVVHENLDPQGPVFRPGSRNVEMRAGLDVRTGEQRILKHYPGAFTQTPLEAYLRRAGADTLIICGFMTHMCCDTTTRQASERGYSVWFASDATATRDLKLGDKVIPHQTIHESTLAVMTRFATVLSTDEILARLRENSSRAS
jgi:nicotinamidase-related amidase